MYHVQIYKAIINCITHYERRRVKKVIEESIGRICVQRYLALPGMLLSRKKLITYVYPLLLGMISLD